MRCHIRCLSLRWRIYYTITESRQSRAVVAELLKLMPSLTQLSIADTHWLVYDDDQLTAMPSIFSSCAGLLPELTYLQFSDDNLLTQDIEYLLSASSPPVFAASLTHLTLSVRRSDYHIAGRLSLLPIIYPNLQRCHVGLEYGSNHIRGSQEWHTAVAALRSLLGSVWCDSEEEARMARSDVEWRLSVGLPAIVDECTGMMVDRQLLDDSYR